MKNCLLLSVIFLLSCSSPHKSLRTADVLKGHKRSEYEAFGKKYMISTQGSGATNAAMFALDAGGNIYDAFVAASFAISVERPQSTGIGGGGFLVHHHAESGKSEAVDFREMAPHLAYKKMFLDKKGNQIVDKSLTGPFASGTPGLVAGVIEVHKKYGKLPLAKAMEPAIRLAKSGFTIYPALGEALEEEKNRLARFSESKEIFFNKNGDVKKTGELLIQKDLGDTLELIAKNGRDGFYKGEVAKEIVLNQKRHKGLIRSKDLNEYKVKWRDPVKSTFKGYDIVSMPPPSSGGTHVIQILNILENDPLKEWGAQSAQAIHHTASAMQLAFADRAKYMGDADFTIVPVKELTSKKYAKSLRALIPWDKAIDPKTLPAPEKMLYESSETTHFTIMDTEGNVVSSTQTINGWFGSAMVAGKTGIVMNNEMDDFASHVGGINLFGAVGGKNNLVEPLKRPLSSMSPTIVFKDKKPYLALGTPSGTRILTCVAQTALNVLAYDMPLYEAVAATRYHQQWSPDQIRVGAPYFSDKVSSQLESMGHKLKKQGLGCKIQAIKWEDDGRLHGVSDPREEGMSFGI